MVIDADIRHAIEFVHSRRSVLSVYLNVDPQQRNSDQYRLALRNLLESEDDCADADRLRVQKYIEVEYDRRGTFIGDV